MYTFPINSINFKKVIGLRLGLGLDLVLVRPSTDSIVQICVHVQILRILFFVCPDFPHYKPIYVSLSLKRVCEYAE